MQVVRQQTALTTSVPAPVGGLNARDALASMPPTDASVMDNMFAYADRVGTRYGYSTLSTGSVLGTGAGSEGFTQLMMWGAGSSAKLFGAYEWLTGATGRLRIYEVDISNGNLTNSRDCVAAGDNLSTLGNWTVFTSGSGTTYLVFVTWQDIAAVSTCVVQAYDGTAWSTPAITGLSDKHNGIHVHRNRLWFYANGSSTKPLSAYYLPIGAIAGAVTEFNVGPYASKGGAIVGIGTWTLDGGVGGTDDRIVFVTNNGQAIVYEGTDPASLATWSLVGVFDMGRTASPFGGIMYKNIAKDAVVMKYGADLLMLTENGVTSANRVLRPAVEGSDLTISGKIRPLLVDAAKQYGQAASSASASLQQWKMCALPNFSHLIVNIPSTATTSFWYAMNTETGAWTKYTGMNAKDMLQFSTYMYFVNYDQKIYKWGLAADDNGTAITYECRQAYNYFDSPNNKLVTLMQPVLRATGNFSITANADVDFNARSISSYTSYTIASEQNVTPWSSPSILGKAVAAHVKGQTSAGVVSWYSTNWAAKPGGFL